MKTFIIAALLCLTASADSNEDFIAAVRARDVATVKRMLTADPALANGRAVEVALFTNVPGRGFQDASKNDVLQAVLAAKPPLDLFQTAALGRADDLARMLREDRARVRAENAFGWTPLHMAAFAGNTAAAKVLLDAGADVHVRAKTRFRNSPLNVALLTGHYETTRLLLDRGADVLGRQAEGFAPIHEAAFIGRLDLVQLLIERGAEINSRTDDGRTALSEALRAKHADVAEFLRSKGAVAGITGDKVDVSPD